MAEVFKFGDQNAVAAKMSQSQFEDVLKNLTPVTDSALDNIHQIPRENQPNSFLVLFGGSLVSKQLSSPNNEFEIDQQFAVRLSAINTIATLANSVDEITLGIANTNPLVDTSINDSNGNALLQSSLITTIKGIHDSGEVKFTENTSKFSRQADESASVGKSFKIIFNDTDGEITVSGDHLMDSGNTETVQIEQNRFMWFWSNSDGRYYPEQQYRLTTDKLIALFNGASTTAKQQFRDAINAEENPPDETP